LSPILGIIASQNYPRVTNSYESIATVTVGSGGTSAITFSSIPSTYKHLQIRGIVKGYINMYLQFNNDAANTPSHFLYGTGGSTGAGKAGEDKGAFLIRTNSSNFGAAVIDILDYASTTKNKTARSLAGWDGNGSGEVWFASGVWLNNTNAINKIDIKPDGAQIDQYSTFALYGIRG
jgi:hypothetical protein